MQVSNLRGRYYVHLYGYICVYVCVCMCVCVCVCARARACVLNTVIFLRKLRSVDCVSCIIFNKVQDFGSRPCFLPRVKESV